MYRCQPACGRHEGDRADQAIRRPPRKRSCPFLQNISSVAVRKAIESYAFDELKRFLTFYSERLPEWKQTTTAITTGMEQVQGAAAIIVANRKPRLSDILLRHIRMRDPDFEPQRTNTAPSRTGRPAAHGSAGALASTRAANSPATPPSPPAPHRSRSRPAHTARCPPATAHAGIPPKFSFPRSTSGSRDLLQRRRPSLHRLGRHLRRRTARSSRSPLPSAAAPASRAGNVRKLRQPPRAWSSQRAQLAAGQQARHGTEVVAREIHVPAQHRQRYLVAAYAAR